MMGILNFFKRQSKNGDDVAHIVQQMFDEAGISPQYPDNGVFMTVIDGVHCSFNTVLKCDEREPGRLFIYSPFPVPVPRNVVGLVSHELNRLNENNQYQSEITIQEKNGEYSIFSFTDYTFDAVPSTSEVRDLMIHTIDLMDNENFRSLMCAIMGYATYGELEKMMLESARVERNEAEIQMTDVYCLLNDKSDGVTSPRYAGRLLMYSIHIIESNISKERAQQLLSDQIPLLLIMQEAYNVADDTQRDILRKLRYLMLCKKTDSDNDNDSILGRLEAFGMIIQDPYSLLV